MPSNSINLIIGAPGTGKTILSQQYMFHNATPERPALYLSTVSEPFDKILRYGQALTFFDSGAIGQRVMYEDLGAVIVAEGLPGALKALDLLMKRHQPALIVIDSFKALRPYAADEAEFRNFLHDLAGRLTAIATSAFWVGEYDADQLKEAAEFAVADSVISLSMDMVSERDVRTLRVVKLRGSGFARGEHTYRITSGGLRVFPRLADRLDSSTYTLGNDRVSTGVPALDRLLGDGYWTGAATLVCGPSGVGKTLMGLQFIVSGAAAGEAGVFATLEENRAQLDRAVRGFGWSLEREGVHVLDRVPIDVYIDEWVYELLDLVEAVGAKRVVIDGLSDLWLTVKDERHFREWAYALTTYFSRIGVSLLMILEVPELFDPVRLSQHGVSQLSDNVLLLQYLRKGDRLQRSLTTLKTRASLHEPVITPFEITNEGITLA
ncbi:MAG: AAA family ATPase [Acidimicrobiaceae bacterium]|nr:AAA family ATPase [Acidimicrobiaceae bacterium]